LSSSTANTVSASSKGHAKPAEGFMLRWSTAAGSFMGMCDCCQIENENCVQTVLHVDGAQLQLPDGRTQNDLLQARVLDSFRSADSRMMLCFRMCSIAAVRASLSCPKDPGRSVHGGKCSGTAMIESTIGLTARSDPSIGQTARSDPSIGPADHFAGFIFEMLLYSAFDGG